MRDGRLKKLGATLGIWALAVGCSGPARPTPVVSTPPASSVIHPGPALEALAGSYTLTLNVSDQCTAIPDAARRRTYQATLEKPSSELPGRLLHAYLPIRIVGGGFTRPTGTGELRSGADGTVSISWNNFDMDGCDGPREPLPDGSSLMVCGEGSVVPGESTLSGAIVGHVWIDDGGTRQGLCAGSHPFTFTRAHAQRYQTAE